MHFGRRRESSRRNGEQLLDARVQLRGRRKQTVFLCSRLRRKAVRNFLLDHEDNGFKIFSILEQSQKNIRRDEVRQIANNSDPLGRLLHAGAAASGLWAEQRVEVNRENIAFDALYVGCE